MRYISIVALLALASMGPSQEVAAAAGPTKVVVQYCGAPAGNGPPPSPSCASNCTSVTVLSGQCVGPSVLPIFGGLSVSFVCDAPSRCFNIAVWQGQGCQGSTSMKSQGECECDGYGHMYQCNAKGVTVSNCAGYDDCSQNCTSVASPLWGQCTDLSATQGGQNVSGKFSTPHQCQPVVVNHWGSGDSSCSDPSNAYNYTVVSGTCSDETQDNSTIYSLTYTCEP